MQIKTVVIQQIEKGDCCCLFLTAEGIPVICKYPFEKMEFNCVAKRNMVKNEVVIFDNENSTADFNIESVGANLRIGKHSLDFNNLIKVVVF